ncbi:MAG: Rrf2 family transcriptional regulator [Dongiaceae bacterium]
MISQKAKYALRAMVVLARLPAGETVLTQDLADTAAVPKRFLEHILLDLKARGLVASRRGKKGGYALLKAPESITFGAVLRIIDGPIAPLPCLSQTAYRRCADCPDEDACEIRHVFDQAYEATRRVLDKLTLRDAISGVDERMPKSSARAEIIQGIGI